MQTNLADAQVDLKRSGFLLEMLAQLTSSLESVVGLEDAEGYFSLVGVGIGEDLSATYRRAFGRDDLSAQEIAAVLVDLKRRIKGGFAIESVTEDQIILVNDRCPFAEKALGRRSLCMMTSNVFGTIASDAAGQANVDLNETIAGGDGRCRVTVYLNQPDAPGLPYFAAQDV